MRRRFPQVKFLGLQEGRSLAAYLAAADAFVFPSRTDTFGVVQLEALACGVPIAAYPVTGPRDVVGNNPIGVLHEDLRVACLGALGISREACRMLEAMIVRFPATLELEDFRMARMLLRTTARTGDSTL